MCSSWSVEGQIVRPQVRKFLDSTGLRRSFQATGASHPTRAGNRTHHLNEGATMATGVVGLARWVFANADRVLRLLQGMTERLPQIGGTMEKAGAALIAAGGALGGRDGAGGARAEVERIRTLLERYETALEQSAADLRSASASLGAIKVPALSTGERTVSLPAHLGHINIPSVIFSDQTPLQGVADIITRQIAHLEGLGQPLRGARDGIGNLGEMLGGTAAELADVGRLLQESGTELKALAG
jgi:hypothetical protein